MPALRAKRPGPEKLDLSGLVEPKQLVPKTAGQDCALFGWDPAGWQPPPNALPINFFGRFVVNVSSPTAAQTEVANELELANESPVRSDATADANSDWEGIVAGEGLIEVHQLTPGRAAVIDLVGVTTWSRQAEYELEWTLGARSGSATTSPVEVLLAPRRGWPYGTADRPSRVPGRRIVLPDRQNVISIGVYVVHRGSSTSSAGTIYSLSQPHYAELSVQGWEVPIDGKGRPVTTTVGGARC